MPTPMDALLEEVSRDHFPKPPATPEQIEAFERRMGWKLDPDLRAFYLHCNGAELLKRLPDCPCRILPLDQIEPAREAIFGTGAEEELGPASQYAICDLQDGDYVMVDVGRQEGGRYPLIDGWHEAWPDPEQCEQIAASFSEFLERAMRAKRPAYWLIQEGQETTAPEPEPKPEPTEPIYYGGLTRADLLRGMGIDPETLEPMKEVPEEIKRRWPYPYQGD